MKAPLFVGTVTTVDGVQYLLGADAQEDLVRHLNSIDHEGSTGWVIEPCDGISFWTRGLLAALGHDLNRAGLRETPARMARMLCEMTEPHDFKFTTFDAEGASEMIVQRGIPFFSLCEHHVVPFFGKAAVAYVPNGKVAGLSKLSRCVIAAARGLQTQERITNAVADRLEKELDAAAVGVVLRARHLCMEMRGVRTHDTETVTSALRGAMLKDDKARQEFLRLADGAQE